MGKKMTAFALAALLVLGLSGCGSNSNRTNNTDRSNGTRSTYGTDGSYNNGSHDNGNQNGDGRGRGIMGELGDGIDDAMDDAGDAVRDAGDALTGDSRRYQEMLENGRVNDSDGFLLDGENRHD